MSNYNKSLFEGVPKKNSQKSRFNLSHEWKSQLLPGKLVPILLLETLPNDEFEIDTEFMFRFEPMYFPIMHKMTMRADYYFIPNRILWIELSSTNSGFAKWIALQNDQAVPTVDAEMKYSSTIPGENLHILGYMGVPLLEEETGYDTIIANLNALPLSAYLKIWDEYYRNTQLEDERWFPLEPGNNDSAFQAALNPGGVNRYYPCLSAKWEMDYFTSAIPTPQIGDAVTIPMNGILPDGSLEPILVQKTDGTPVSDGTIKVDSGKLNSDGLEEIAFLEQATIKQLRLAETLQSFYERIMKVGQRYRDFIKGFWEIDPEPGVVDVPIMIGSKFGRVQIADVMTQASNVTNADWTQYSQTGDYAGQANMYENGGSKIEYKCREHGFIMAILQVNANTSYGQGVDRLWRRIVQTDYALDSFASIGDQEILKEEVLFNNKTTDLLKNEETFGYIPRFSEYRYKNNIQTMQLNFQGGLSQTLGRWWNRHDTVGSIYDQEIEINQFFVSSDPAQNGGHRLVDVFRILPSGVNSEFPSQAVMFAHIFHSVYVNRQLPMFSTPKLT